MALEFTTSYLKDVISLFRYNKGLGDRAIAQAPDASLAATLDPESNSIATIVKHLSGNMRSRWTDFLTSDGEKPSRNRDGEFEAPPQTRAEVVVLWESGWKCTFDALATLTDENLTQTDLHPHRAAFRDAGHQPATRPQRVSRGTDRLSGQAFRRRKMDHAERPSRPVSRFQRPRRQARSLPALSQTQQNR